MLAEYRQHVAQRAEQGLPPLPLDEKQISQLIELLNQPPAGEEAFYWTCLLTGCLPEWMMLQKLRLNF